MTVIALSSCSTHKQCTINYPLNMHIAYVVFSKQRKLKNKLKIINKINDQRMLHIINTRSFHKIEPKHTTLVIMVNKFFVSIQIYSLRLSDCVHIYWTPNKNLLVYKVWSLDPECETYLPKEYVSIVRERASFLSASKYIHYGFLIVSTSTRHPTRTYFFTRFGGSIENVRHTFQTSMYLL